MKKYITISILLALLASGISIPALAQEDESLGLPGDNLNLYAVMKLFQESETLEGFEKNLNDENSKINNLDLDGDNYIDYIRVMDYADGNVHTIVLQVPVSKNENQDVAVFTVQREADGRVYIQLIGDQALYGKDYIIEPYYDTSGNKATPNPGYAGNTTQQVTIVNTTPAQIASWPVITYIYMPAYSPWRSSWYWGYYPPYWRPWRPYYWHYYYGYHYNWNNHYHGYYHRYPSYRYAHYNDFYYTNRRATSVNVNVRVQSGNYKSTYSRPEMRSKGEEDFVKANPSVSRRASDNSSVSGTPRRSDNPANVNENRSSAGSERRADQSTISSDRSNSTRANTGTKNNTGTNTSATRRSTGDEMSKASSNSASRRINTKVETERKSSSSAGSSSDRRSSSGNSSSKSSTSSKKSETGKAAETTKPPRRK
jgi:hypothetical protein